MWGMKMFLENLDKEIEKIDYETRLKVAAFVIKNILEHAKEGGSYRYLIYERLGFEADAYGVLQEAGALEISNEFNIDQMNEIKQVVRENKIDVLKPLLHMCDEPGCFKQAGCGFPGKDGYRWTCYDHYRKATYGG